MTTRPPDWDAVYEASTPPPWDIGRPQPTFVRLADSGLLCGRVLDVGCGTGEHALLAAACGADVVGVDVSPRAINQARGKAAERGVTARFEVADALNLGQLAMTFDTVIDSGLFHVFDDEVRARYVTSLASVLKSGGNCYLMCFSDRQPGDRGPAGFARTNSLPRSATAGPSPTSRRSRSRSTPDSAPRRHTPGLLLSTGCDPSSPRAHDAGAVWRGGISATAVQRRERHDRALLSGHARCPGQDGSCTIGACASFATQRRMLHTSSRRTRR